MKDHKAVNINDLTGRIQRAITLEKEAHRIFDEAVTNLAFSNLTDELRRKYVGQTYRATGLHAQAMDILRGIAGEMDEWPATESVWGRTAV